MIIGTFFCTRLIGTSVYIGRSVVLRLTYTFLITPSELQLILYRLSASFFDLEIYLGYRQGQGPCHKGFSWDDLGHLLQQLQRIYCH